MDDDDDDDVILISGHGSGTAGMKTMLCVLPSAFVHEITSAAGFFIIILHIEEDCLPPFCAGTNRRPHFPLKML